MPEFCPICGEELDMSPEAVAECKEIASLEFGAAPNLTRVCEDCWAKEHTTNA